MLLARQVFQANCGRGDELVTLFRELNACMRDAVELMPEYRILTGASDPFLTVVTEVEEKNFAAWDEGFREAMGRPWMGEWFSRMMPLVESGSREFYNNVE